jgi:56kDa selenium binding protein (SBP56)
MKHLFKAEYRMGRPNTRPERAATPEITMANWIPDPDFLSLSATGGERATGEAGLRRKLRSQTPANDELAVVGLDSKSLTYGQVVRRVEMPGAGDELHHRLELMQLVLVPEYAASARRAMGWLFAAALGFHRGRRVVVVQSLVPIASGHLQSISGASKSPWCWV